MNHKALNYPQGSAHVPAITRRLRAATTAAHRTRPVGQTSTQTKPFRCLAVAIGDRATAVAMATAASPFPPLLLLLPLPLLRQAQAQARGMRMITNRGWLLGQRGTNPQAIPRMPPACAPPPPGRGVERRRRGSRSRPRRDRPTGSIASQAASVVACSRARTRRASRGAVAMSYREGTQPTLAEQSRAQQSRAERRGWWRFAIAAGAAVG
jgi:hypothetical protein